MIPVLDLKAQYAAIEQEIDAAIREVLLSTQFILGPAVRGLEQRVAAYCGCKYGVGVASGTTASQSIWLGHGVGLCSSGRTYEKLGPGSSASRVAED